MKFSVGEVVVYVGWNAKYTGNEAEILAAGPWAPEQMRDPRGRLNAEHTDYLIKFKNGASGFVTEPFLIKRPYKDQHTPAEQSFRELIEYLNRVTANQEESR